MNDSILGELAPSPFLRGDLGVLDHMSLNMCKFVPGEVSNACHIGTKPCFRKLGSVSYLSKFIISFKDISKKHVTHSAVSPVRTRSSMRMTVVTKCIW